MGIPSIKFQLGESWPPVMDFSARLSRGETITGVTSVTITPTTTPPLTAGTPSYTGTQVQFTLSGGKTGTRYVVEVKVVTTLGTRIGVGYVQLETDGD